MDASNVPDTIPLRVCDAEITARFASRRGHPDFDVAIRIST